MMDRCIQLEKNSSTELACAGTVRPPAVLLSPPINARRYRNVQELAKLPVVMWPTFAAQSPRLLADVETDCVYADESGLQAIDVRFPIDDLLVGIPQAGDVAKQRIEVVHHKRGRDRWSLDAEKRLCGIEAVSPHGSCDDGKPVALSLESVDHVSQTTPHKQRQQGQIFDLLLFAQDELPSLTPGKPARDAQRDHCAEKLGPAGQLVVIFQNSDQIYTTYRSSNFGSAGGQRQGRQSDSHPHHYLPEFQPLLGHHRRIAFSANSTTAGPLSDNWAAGGNAEPEASAYG